jgi:hypothetical protein
VGFIIVTELPGWGLILCALVGALFTYLLYRNSSFKTEVSPLVFKILQGARFLLITLLCGLLLGPMIKTIVREVEKPILILAMDASESVATNDKVKQQRSEVLNSFSKIKDQLSDKFDVKMYSFGDNPKEGIDSNATDKTSNFTKLYDNLDVQFVNRNVGALVVASDGLYNAGGNPVYGPSRLKMPIHTIALGDTIVKKDLLITKVTFNKVAFLGNSFPIQINIEANQCVSSRAILTIESDSLNVYSKSIDISNNNFRLTVPVLFDATKKGIRNYKIKLAHLENEVTYINNEREIFIEVVESKEKILILSGAPNPDVAALRQIIETSPNYDVKVEQVSTFNERFGDYGLVILHSIPGINQSINPILDKLKSSGTSMLFVLGASSDLNAFNALNTGLDISQGSGKLSDAQAVISPDFSLFTLEKEISEEIKNWPPLKSPFGIYSQRSNIYSLAYQKIGNVISNQPLIYFNEQQGQKTGVIVGEGIWKWRLADYSANENHTLSNALILKVIQYLSVKDVKSPFKIFTKSTFNENENVIFDAELFDQSDNLVNTPEVKLTLANRQKKQFQYTFSRTEKTYTLNTGILPVGKYSYKSEVKLGDKLYVQQGEFSVNQLQLETTNTTADYQLLRTLSSRTGGKLFESNKADELIQLLSNDEDIKPVSYTKKKLEDFINLPALFFTFIALLSLEWFIRKRSGSY